MTMAGTANNTLSINGMTGDACVEKVKTALKGCPGVTTQSVNVGSATINADPAGCTAACAAIKSAGFEAKQTFASQGGQSGKAGATGDQPSDKARDGASSPVGAPEAKLSTSAPAPDKAAAPAR